MSISRYYNIISYMKVSLRTFRIHRILKYATKNCDIITFYIRINLKAGLSPSNPRGQAKGAAAL